MMERLRHWIGGRLVKTGIAVLITSAVLLAFDLPVVYAVMATIVSIEPTAADSLRKGMIRFPAAVLGAAFALFFDYLLGPIPITYALATMATIFFCYRFGWQDGLIVATLTAIVMIPSTEGDFTAAFFTRMLTTLIGIAVATMVNLLIFPPRFAITIRKQVPPLREATLQLLEDWVRSLLQPAEQPVEQGQQELLHRYHQGKKQLHQLLQLQSYQEEERRYRRWREEEVLLDQHLEWELQKIQVTYDFLDLFPHLAETTGFAVVAPVEVEQIEGQLQLVRQLLRGESGSEVRVGDGGEEAQLKLKDEPTSYLGQLMTMLLSTLRTRTAKAESSKEHGQEVSN